MVIYSRDEKILIIPIGESDIDGSISTTPCEWAEKQAYESGWTAGYYSGITKDCGEAIEEAFSSGVTKGYSQGREAGYRSGFRDNKWGMMLEVCYNEWGGETPEENIKYIDGETESNPFTLEYLRYDYLSYISGATTQPHFIAYGIYPFEVYNSMEIRQHNDLTPSTLFLYGHRNANRVFISCDNFVVDTPTSLDDVWQALIPDYRTFPAGFIYSRPVEDYLDNRQYWLDGEYGYFDTIPAGTHTIQLELGNLTNVGYMINLNYFKGDIKIQ